MNIAILGTGTVGQALARKLSELNHNIYIGTRDVQKTLANTENDSWGQPPISFMLKDHPELHLETFETAVEKGNDLIVFAMNGARAFDCLDAVGDDLLQDQLMIDISNPLDFSDGFPPSLLISNTDSLGEQIQKRYPSLKVVKTLNTMSNPVMINPDLLEGDHSVFMSGNDEDAKQQVSQLLQSFGWKEHNIIDLGDITTARGTEMILPIWVRLYGKLQTPIFNFYVNTKVK